MSSNPAVRDSWNKFLGLTQQSEEVVRAWEEADLREVMVAEPGLTAIERANVVVFWKSLQGQTTLGMVPLPRQYPVGVVGPSPAMYFMIERSEKDFYNKVVSGGLYLLHGPRQSGKTTSIIQMCSTLQTNSLTPIYFSMEYYSKHNHKGFFDALARYLRTHYPLFPEMQATKNGFIDYFAGLKMNVVVFVDEFDEALSLPDKHDLLDALRHTRNTKHLQPNHGLHAFVGIGTYGMIDLVSRTPQYEDDMEDSEATTDEPATGEPAKAALIKCKSPFNLAQFLPVSNFSREDHKALHITQAGLPAEWEEDIWWLTNGKPGACVWVGSQALTAYQKGPSPEIAYWWAAKTKLVAAFANTETMKRMLQDIQTPEQKKLLYTILRRESYQVGRDERPVAEQLAACGAVVIDSNIINASAPIIQQVILFCVDVVERPRLRAAEIPYCTDSPTLLNIPEVIRLIVSDFDWNDICDKYCTKQLRIEPFRLRKGNDDLRYIADENTFQAAFLIGLRALLCDRPGVPISICLAETKEATLKNHLKARLDVLIHNHAIYVVELCTNVGPKDPEGIEYHVEKTASYAKAYKANQAFCVNFVGFDYSQVKNWTPAGVIQSQGISVHLIHVRYSDPTAFPTEPIQPSEIVTGLDTKWIVPRTQKK